jgi:hypothetical protein
MKRGGPSFSSLEVILWYIVLRHSLRPILSYPTYIDTPIQYPLFVTLQNSEHTRYEGGEGERERDSWSGLRRERSK